jgi:two-component system, OmpR family, response regulator
MLASRRTLDALIAMNILLIEDDADIAEALIKGLQSNGYVVQHATDGQAGFDEALNHPYDVLIVDRNLPNLDGLTLVRQLRQSATQTPVLFLTALSGIDDRVVGLEAGADDYLVKPFAFQELLARVRVMARRQTPASSTRLTVGPLEIDLLKRVAWRDGRELELLPQEFRLLEYLMRNANRVVTRAMILEQVWEIHFDPLTSVVESHMSRMRGKLNQNGAEELIQTVRGAGYRLRAP